MALLSKSNTNLSVDENGNVIVLGNLLLDSPLPAIILKNDATNQNSLSISNGNLLVGGSDTGRAIIFRSLSAYGEAARFDSSGRFGIGRTPVTDILEVQGNATVYGKITAYENPVISYSDDFKAQLESNFLSFAGTQTQVLFKTNENAVASYSLKHANGEIAIAYSPDGITTIQPLSYNGTNGIYLPNGFCTGNVGVTINAVTGNFIVHAANNPKLSFNNSGLWGTGSNFASIYYDNTTSNALILEAGGSMKIKLGLSANYIYNPTIFSDTVTTERLNVNATMYPHDIQATGRIHAEQSVIDLSTASLWNINGSFNGTILRLLTTRGNSTAYRYLDCYSSDYSDLEFSIDGTGAVYADGAISANNGDYADYFEWEDGNPTKEDRKGVTVVTVNEKIRPAEKGEHPIGVVSRLAVMIGNMGWNVWEGKYLKDDYGAYVYKTVEKISWTEKLKGEKKRHLYSVDKVPKDVTVPVAAERFKVREKVLNENYNPRRKYVPRKERPEWDPIGFIGRVRIKKGQPTSPYWVKLRDISDNVEEWLIK